MFWEMTWCSLLEGYWSFEVSYCFHLQERNVSQARKQHPYNKQTDCMELSPSWEAVRRSATEEFPKILLLWDQKIHYRVHRKPPLVSLLRQVNQSIAPSPIFSLRSILILSYNLRAGFHNGLFPSCFPTKILYAFLPRSCYMPCPNNGIRGPRRVDCTRYKCCVRVRGIPD
jgi:hypothetical protein